LVPGIKTALFASFKATITYHASSDFDNMKPRNIAAT
jgi:hypothetical protein